MWKVMVCVFVSIGYVFTIMAGQQFLEDNAATQIPSATVYQVDVINGRPYFTGQIDEDCGLVNLSSYWQAQDFPYPKWIYSNFPITIAPARIQQIK